MITWGSFCDKKKQEKSRGKSSEEKWSQNVPCWIMVKARIVELSIISFRFFACFSISVRWQTFVLSSYIAKKRYESLTTCHQDAPSSDSYFPFHLFVRRHFRENLTRARVVSDNASTTFQFYRKLTQSLKVKFYSKPTDALTIFFVAMEDKK